MGGAAKRNGPADEGIHLEPAVVKVERVIGLRRRRVNQPELVRGRRGLALGKGDEEVILAKSPVAHALSAPFEGEWTARTHDAHPGGRVASDRMRAGPTAKQRPVNRHGMGPYGGAGHVEGRLGEGLVEGHFRGRGAARSVARGHRQRRGRLAGEIEGGRRPRGGSRRPGGSDVKKGVVGRRPAA